MHSSVQISFNQAFANEKLTTLHHTVQHNRKKAHTYTVHSTQYAHCLCTFEKKLHSRASFELNSNGVVEMNVPSKWQANSGKKYPPHTNHEFRREEMREKDPQQSFKCTVTLLAIMRTFYMCLYTNSDKMLFTSRCDLMLPECEE